MPLYFELTGLVFECILSLCWDSDRGGETTSVGVSDIAGAALELPTSAAPGASDPPNRRIHYDFDPTIRRPTDDGDGSRASGKRCVPAVVIVGRPSSIVSIVARLLPSLFPCGTSSLFSIAIARRSLPPPVAFTSASSVARRPPSEVLRRNRSSDGPPLRPSTGPLTQKSNNPPAEPK